MFRRFFTQFVRSWYNVRLAKRNVKITKLIAYKRQERPNSFYKTNINFKLIINKCGK